MKTSLSSHFRNLFSSSQIRAILGNVYRLIMPVYNLLRAMLSMGKHQVAGNGSWVKPKLPWLPSIGLITLKKQVEGALTLVAKKVCEVLDRRTFVIRGANGNESLSR